MSIYEVCRRPSTVARRRVQEMVPGVRQVEQDPCGFDSQLITKVFPRTSQNPFIRKRRVSGVPEASAILLFLFLYLAALRLCLFDDLLLQLARDHVVVMHFHVEAAAALGH